MCMLSYFECCGEEEREREKPKTARVREIKKCDLMDTCMRRYIGDRRERRERIERREREWALAQ